MKVDLRNVGIIKHCHLEFVSGVNLIVGSSGSGKSTLMRCLYNFASNGFSDADISFGKDTMQVVIENGNDTLEYSRSLKTNGVKCYYKVNGEQYVKLGRAALPQVKDALKIGDIAINNESINFNFNLQFAAPFLILGSQSTLYNVLTYRSSFDITSINDYYNEDLRSNKEKISTSTKVKNHLADRLDELKKQESALKPAEELYSYYMRYKHKRAFRDEIEILHNSIAELHSLTELSKKQVSLCVKIDKCIKEAELHLTLISFCEKLNTLTKLVTESALYDKISSLYEEALSAERCLVDLLSIKSLMAGYNKEFRKSKLLLLSEDIYAASATKELVLSEIAKLKTCMASKENFCTKIDLLSSLNCDKLESLKHILDVKSSLIKVQDIDTRVEVAVSKEKKILEETSKFKVCPLCGSEVSVCHD